MATEWVKTYGHIWLKLTHQLNNLSKYGLGPNWFYSVSPNFQYSPNKRPGVIVSMGHGIITPTSPLYANALHLFIS